MPKAFTIYRIICTATDKAFVYGSDFPHDHRLQTWVEGKGWTGPFWYDRGHWSEGRGNFWSGRHIIREHLQKLCHDWKTVTPTTAPYHSYQRRITEHPDWSRLEFLKVEEIHVTEHSTTVLPASDFMGLQDRAAVAS